MLRKFKTSEKKREYSKKHYQLNKEKYRIQHRNYQRQTRKKILSLLGSKCVRCGEVDWRCLQIDHIHGGGNKEFKKMSRNSYYLSLLRNSEETKKRFQILCANCNWKKKYENNEV